MNERRGSGKIILRAAAALLLSAMLAGCKADDVDIKLNVDDIASAIGGSKPMVPFQVTFSTLGDLKDDQKADVEKLKGIVARYVSVDDFRIEKAEYKTEIIVEGEIPVVYAKSGNFAGGQAAWVVGISDTSVTSIAAAFPYTVQLRATEQFDALKSEAQSVNFMLAPDAYGPTRLRIKNGTGKPLKILFGGAQSDSSSSLIGEQELSPSATVIFKGGVYDEIGAGFYLSSPQ